MFVRWPVELRREQRGRRRNLFAPDGIARSSVSSLSRDGRARRSSERCSEFSTTLPALGSVQCNNSAATRTNFVSSVTQIQPLASVWKARHLLSAGSRLPDANNARWRKAKRQFANVGNYRKSVLDLRQRIYLADPIQPYYTSKGHVFKPTVCSCKRCANLLSPKSDLIRANRWRKIGKQTVYPLVFAILRRSRENGCVRCGRDRQNRALLRPLQ